MENFPHLECQQIEAAFLGGKKDVEVNTRKRTYSINFQDMEMTEGWVFKARTPVIRSVSAVKRGEMGGGGGDPNDTQPILLPAPSLEKD